MKQKPRSATASLFDKPFSIRLAWQGVMVGAVTLAAYALGEYVLSPDGMADAMANTMAFATLTISQLFHAFDVRSEDESIFKIGLLSNPAMNKAFVVGVVLQAAVLFFPPLMGVFQVVALTGIEWACVLGLSLTPVIICEIEKAVRRSLRAKKA